MAAYSEPEERSVQIESDGAVLVGDIVIPEGAGGVVIFVHGSGSGRHSLRNRRVAETLWKEGLATLLFNLLTEEEEIEDAATKKIRFDIGLLAERLLAATAYVRALPETDEVPVGYFGASTGAAAALMAAARQPEVVSAIVSRGGRPDLADFFLDQVRAPTLLLVGGADDAVIDLNHAARQKLRVPSELAVIPGAGHLFEEPGAMDEVCRLASAWFGRYLEPTLEPTS